jgi:hypothetical protein
MRDIPDIPSNGRCTTSNVALSTSSSRIRTSCGPWKEARICVDPAIKPREQLRAEIDAGLRLTHRNRIYRYHPSEPEGQSPA